MKKSVIRCILGLINDSDFCPQLQTHGDVMIKTDSDSYLGDIVESSGKNTKNINARCGRGWGITTNIIMILKEVCLGQFYFTVALILRESLLFSSVLLNSETWTNVTAAEINQLQNIDNSLLRRILGCPAKTAICSLYLDTAALPIKNVLMGKRIMFLHYLLNLPQSDLTYRIFQAQVDHPVKNDWVLQVNKDLSDIGMADVSFEEIKKKSKNVFKKDIKVKIRRLAFETLMKEKETKSKLKNLKYDSLTIQPYLVSDQLSIPQKQLIFKIRVRMIETPDSYGRDVPCRLCHLARDEMSHVLDCIVLKLAGPGLYRDSDVSITDAFEGNNIEKMKKLAIAFQEALRTREILINKNNN